MVSFDEFANELKAFSNSGAIVNEIRKDLRKPLPELRTAVRASAIAKLPSGGGLGAWVAKARLSAELKAYGRAAGIRVKVSRKSTKDKAALKQLDEGGTLRHPLYGNRRHWYSQVVASRYFSDVWDSFGPQFIKAADDAVDRALDKIRKG